MRPLVRHALLLLLGACGTAQPPREGIDAIDLSLSASPASAPAPSSSAAVRTIASSAPADHAGDGLCGKPYAPGSEEAYARAKKLVDLLGAEGHPTAGDMQRGMVDLEHAAEGGIRNAEADFGLVVFSSRFGDHSPRIDERDLYVRAFKHLRLAAIRGDSRVTGSFPDLAKTPLPPKLEEPLAQFQRAWIDDGVKQADNLLACNEPHELR